MGKMTIDKREATLVLSLFLMLGFSQSRVVTVPFSPLVRVTGQTVSIRCDVFDYEGPREQDFEWEVLQGSLPLRLISTFDTAFPDPPFKKRVKSGAISVERLKDNVVELRILNASVADNAVYRCTTLSTDSSISGNYFADVELKVVGDNLKVSPVAAPAVVLEGSALELRCNATRDLADRTYLSVTWSVQRGTLPLQDIVTFGPDGVVKAGSAFAQRLADGGLRIDSHEGGAFLLTLSESLPSDQGIYTCTARQWVLEGKNSWESIMQRTVELGEVKVTPTRENLKVSVEKTTVVSVGDSVHLNCSISADNLPSLGLEVDWLISPSAHDAPSTARTLVQMSRDGLVANMSSIVGLTRVKLGLFGLSLHDVDQSSSGFYSCRVRAWIRQSNGTWYQAAENVSDPVELQVSLLASEFKVNLRNPVRPLSEGSPMELECCVTDASRLRDTRLAVTWQRASASLGDLSASSQLIGTLDRDGNLLPGDAFQQLVGEGRVVLSKVKPDTFRLRFIRMNDVDMGSYSCVISAWTRARDGGWGKVAEVPSSPLTIFWETKNLVLNVKAEALREPAASGSTFEMSCQVMPPSPQGVEYSVRIQKALSPGGKTLTILSLTADAILMVDGWGEQDRLDSLALQKVGQGEFRFRISGAKTSDQGVYFCDVTAWIRDTDSSWNKAISAESNRVSLAFMGLGPAFNVSIRLETKSVYSGDTATMICAVSSQDGSSMKNLYEVQWYWTPVHDSDPSDRSDLLISGREGVVNKYRRCEMKQCELHKVDSLTYRVAVQNLQDSDSGEYHCKVTSWLQNTPLTKGYEVVSDTVLVKVRFSVWRSVTTPLLIGCGISVMVGLLSILIGYAFAHCCQNTSRSTRSRNKLMDIEMD